MKQVDQISTHDLASNDIRKTFVLFAMRGHFNALAHMHTLYLLSGWSSAERMQSNRLNVHSTRLRAMAKSEHMPWLVSSTFATYVLYVSESKCASCISFTFCSILLARSRFYFIFFSIGRPNIMSVHIFSWYTLYSHLKIRCDIGFIEPHWSTV